MDVEFNLQNREAPTEKIGTGVFVASAKAFSNDEELEELRSAHSSIFKAAPGAPEFDKERVLTFVATDETPDRSGDIVRVDGGNIKNFMRNPVFLKQHEYDDACGRVLVFKKISNAEGSPNGKAWLAKVYFPKEVEESEEIFMKYKHGILSAVSIRFVPTQMNRPTDPNERKTLGLGEWGYEILKWEMLELSAVSVPCNPNALIQKGLKMDPNSRIKELEMTIGTSLSNFEKRITALEADAKIKKEIPQEDSVDSLVAFMEDKEFKL